MNRYPVELEAAFKRSVTVEYATLTRSGWPVTVSVSPYLGTDGTLDVSTGLAFPAKAERARDHPKVGLLFADPIGAGMADALVVLAPAGQAPPPWRDAPPDWRPLLSRALAGSALVDLTVVEADGYPLCLPVQPGTLEGNRLSLSVGPGAPTMAAGPACLTVHSYGEVFTSQANLSLVGQFRPDGGLAFEAERALGDWSVPANRLRAGLETMAKRRRLSPRAAAEAARRGQPVPVVRVPRRADRP